jgi:hypothetical protein
VWHAAATHQPSCGHRRSHGTASVSHDARTPCGAALHTPTNTSAVTNSTSMRICSARMYAHMQCTYVCAYACGYAMSSTLGLGEQASRRAWRWTSGGQASATMGVGWGRGGYQWGAGAGWGWVGYQWGAMRSMGCTELRSWPSTLGGRDPGTCAGWPGG